eukprot:435042_1
MVSLSICNGADGMVAAFGDSFVLEPLDRSGGSVLDRLSRAHAFYKMEDDSDFANARCGVGHQQPSLLGQRLRNNSGVKLQSTLGDIRSGSARLQEENGNIVDLLVVNDFNRIREFDGDLGAVQEDTISIINGVNALYANMFSEPLRIRLVGQMNFDQGNPFGPTGSDLDAVIDSSELLLDFQDWRATMIILSGLPDHDAAHAFLGQRFNFGGISGVSNQGQICRDLFFPPFMALAID